MPKTSTPPLSQTTNTFIPKKTKALQKSNLKNTSTYKPPLSRLYPIILPIIAFILFVLIIVFIYLNYAKLSAKLEILVTPISAVTEINGKTYKNGTYNFEPGNYTATIKKDGFTEKTVHLELKANETTQLYDYLVQSDGSYSWYLEHPEDDLILTEVGDFEADAASAAYQNRHPIIADLPIIYINYSDDLLTYTEYRIDGGDIEGCHAAFCLKITDSTGGNYDAALKLLEEKGHNPSDYEILYEYVPIIPLD